MNKLMTQITVFFFIVVAFSGCASTQLNQTLDQKLLRMKPVNVSSETERLLQTKSNLTPEIREKLDKVRAATHLELNGIDELSRKLRVMLIRDITSSTYDSDEVSLIKSRLKDLEEKRIQTLFSAADEANRIMGCVGRSLGGPLQPKTTGTGSTPSIMLKLMAYAGSLNDNIRGCQPKMFPVLRV